MTMLAKGKSSETTHPAQLSLKFAVKLMDFPHTFFLLRVIPCLCVIVSHIKCTVMGDNFKDIGQVIYDVLDKDFYL